MRYLILLALSAAAYAQLFSSPTIIKGNPPTGIGGACISTPRIGYLDASGNLITCPSATHIWTVISGGGGNVVLTTGSGAPSSSCAAPTSSNLAVYLDTTNQDEWWCSATNTWKKILSVTGSGPYVLTGAVGSAPSAPAAGSVSCYFDSTTLTQVCLDASGNAFTMTKGIANPSDTKVVNYIGTDGVQVRISQSGGSTFNLTSGLFDPFFGTLGLGLDVNIPGSASAPAAHCSGTSWCGYQFIVPAGMSIPLNNAFFVEAGTWLPGDVFQLSVFTDSSNTPGSKIANSDAAITGINSCSIYCQKAWGSTHPSLTQGVYWLMFSTNSALGNWYGVNIPVNFQNATNGFTIKRYIFCSNAVTYSGASTVHPSTCTSPAAATFTDSIPMVYIVP